MTYIVLTVLLIFGVLWFTPEELDDFSTLEQVGLVTFWPITLFVCFIIAIKKLYAKYN